jgi:phosphate transport system permease protein
LAAVPSVVSRPLGIFALAPLLREYVEPARYASRLPATLSGPSSGLRDAHRRRDLGDRDLPTIASVRQQKLRRSELVSRRALALGATRWEAIQAAMRYGRTGIMGAILLGFGRAIGETMAVTMVIGNSPEIKASLFAPSYTMASVIANEFAEATGDLHLASLAEVGLLLFAVTLLLNVIARLLVWRVAHPVRRTR